MPTPEEVRERRIPLQWAKAAIVACGVRDVRQHAGTEFVLCDGRVLTLWTDENGHCWEGMEK